MNKYSLAKCFFRKFSPYNRIPNGILEKNFTDFFGNFSVDSDYEPYVAYTQPFGSNASITIDWCVADTAFFISVYEKEIFLFKNKQQITIKVNTNTLQTVDDYVKGWIS